MMAPHEENKTRADGDVVSRRKEYDLIGKIIETSSGKVGVEIGVAFGGLSEAILKLPAITKLYGIDPYQCFDGYEKDGFLSQTELDDLSYYTLSRLSLYGDRYVHIRKPSDEAIDAIPGELDFLIIDARYSSRMAVEDLCTWFNKICDGGIIAGLYENRPESQDDTQVIKEFFHRFGWEIYSENEGVWWVEKRPLLVSFIMPAFNCGNTICQSIESIMDGNLCDGDEVVVVNDGSSDDTASVLKRLQERFPQVAVIDHKRNKGGGAARNTAVEHTRNSLIFCLDSDNILETASITPLKMFLASSYADVVAFQEVRYFNSDDPRKTTHKWIFPSGKFNLADYLSGAVVPGASGNYMFTKESWIRAGGYPEFSSALDTWGFGFRQLATNSRIAVMPATYYYHRYGYESYWNREAKKRNISLHVIQILIPYLDLLDDNDIDYIFSRRGRYTWFENLSKRPVRVKGRTIGHAGITTSPQKTQKTSTISSIKNWISRTIRTVAERAKNW